jgi:hypothetical protein
MYLIPFIKRQFKTQLSPEKIKEILIKATSPPDWKLDANKLFDFKIIEGEISQNRFTIAHGSYALTYGKTSLLPVLRGRFQRGMNDKFTEIYIVIHPHRTGMIILSIFYLLAMVGFVICIKKGLTGSMTVISIFLLSTYGILIAKFNKEVKMYLAFLRNEMNAF